MATVSLRLKDHLAIVAKQREIKFSETVPAYKSGKDDFMSVFGFSCNSDSAAFNKENTDCGGPFMKDYFFRLIVQVFGPPDEEIDIFFKKRMKKP